VEAARIIRASRPGAGNSRALAAMLGDAMEAMALIEIDGLPMKNG